MSSVAISSMLVALATAADGLVAHINFDGDDFNAAPTSGPGGQYVTFLDHSGTGNHATCYRSVIVGGVAYPMDQCPAPVMGPDHSQAAEFFGTLCDVQSDHLGIANAPSLRGLSHGSIALWVLYHRQMKIGGVLQDAFRSTRLINDFKYAVPGSWFLGRDGTTANLFKANNDSGDEQKLLVFPDSNLYSGEYETWNHIAVTWDGTTVRGYYNGTRFTEVPQQGFTAFSEGTYIAVAALNHGDLRNSLDHNCVNSYGGDPNQTYVQPNTGFLNGALDDLRIYNRALGDDEVAALVALADPALVRPTRLLTVRSAGGGHGYIGSSPRGIDCGKYCVEAFVPGSTLTLTAWPPADGVFSSWEGPCSGDGGCRLTITADTTVTASYPRVVEDVSAIEAESAALTAPLVARNHYVIQPGQNAATLATGGRLEYTFELQRAGDVLVMGTVNCPDTSTDSFFVSIDAEPTDPTSIWDIGSTVGFEERLVQWRGTGDSDHAQFSPKWWSLEAGTHKLIVIGRESGAMIDRLTIVQKLQRFSSAPACHETTGVDCTPEGCLYPAAADQTPCAADDDGNPDDLCQAGLCVRAPTTPMTGDSPARTCGCGAESASPFAALALLLATLRRRDARERGELD